MLRAMVGGLLLAAFAAGCAREQKPLRPAQPPLTAASVAVDIVGKGPAEGLDGWLFKPDEPRDVKLIGVAYQRDSAAATVHVETQWTGNYPTQQNETWHMAGRINVHYRWNDGQWQLTRLENLTFKRQ